MEERRHLTCSPRLPGPLAVQNQTVLQHRSTDLLFIFWTDMKATQLAEVAGVYRPTFLM